MPLTLVLYLWAMVVWQCRIGFVERDILEMAPPIQSPAKCEVRSVIWFFRAKGEHSVEILIQIVAVYGNVMNRQNVTKWCRDFSEGKIDVHDEQRSGRPSLITYNLLQETVGKICANWCVMIRELHHIIPKVSKNTINEAVIENLGYRKLCKHWVPKMLTEITKRNRWVPCWSFSRATHRKEMNFWTPLWLEMKHGVFTTLLNSSDSHCKDAIRFPQNQKIQNYNLSEKNHGVFFLGQKRHSPGRLHESWRNN